MANFPIEQNSKLIQWYPGHIAKAIRQLNQNIKKVDLIIEVRDARIPISSSHPFLKKWTEGKKHLLVINREDMICEDSKDAWNTFLKRGNQNPIWCDAKTGKGVKKIHYPGENKVIASNSREITFQIHKMQETNGLLKSFILAIKLPRDVNMISELNFDEEF